MTSTRLLGVLMIDDEGIIIKGVQTFLRCSHEQFRVTDFFYNVNDALEKTKNNTFDIILLDLWLKHADPIDNVTKLKRAFPDIPIVVFTSESSEEWERKMLKMGVAAFGEKTSMPSNLISKLHKAYSGETMINKREKTMYYYESSVSPNAIRYKKDHLPILQKEIIGYLSEGLCIKNIAYKKGKSISYIDKILNNLRKSFHVANNAELVNLFYS